MADLPYTFRAAFRRSFRPAIRRSPLGSRTHTCRVFGLTPLLVSTNTNGIRPFSYGSKRISCPFLASTSSRLQMDSSSCLGCSVFNLIPRILEASYGKQTVGRDDLAIQRVNYFRRNVRVLWNSNKGGSDVS